MTKEELLLKYAGAESHFDMMASSIVASKGTLALFVVYTVALLALGHFL